MFIVNSKQVTRIAKGIVLEMEKRISMPGAQWPYDKYWLLAGPFKKLASIWYIAGPTVWM